MVTVFAKVRLFHLPKCSISGFKTVSVPLKQLIIGVKIIMHTDWNQYYSGIFLCVYEPNGGCSR